MNYADFAWGIQHIAEDTLESWMIAFEDAHIPARHPNRAIAPREYAGHQKTLELFGAPKVQTMAAYHVAGIKELSAKEFYDDSLMREIDATGYFDELYK